MCEDKPAIEWIERDARGDLETVVVPENNIVEVAPGVPADPKIEVEPIGEVKGSRNALVPGAVQSLGTVKHCSRIIRVRGAVLGPSRVVKTWSFEVLVQQISHRLTRSDRQHKQIGCTQ